MICINLKSIVCHMTSDSRASSAKIQGVETMSLKLYPKHRLDFRRKTASAKGKVRRSMTLTCGGRCELSRSGGPVTTGQPHLPTRNTSPPPPRDGYSPETAPCLGHVFAAVHREMRTRIAEKLGAGKTPDRIFSALPAGPKVAAESSVGTDGPLYHSLTALVDDFTRLGTAHK